MLVLLCPINLTQGIFLWHWWPIRKRLSRDWSLNTNVRITQVEFLRIFVTVSSVLFVWFPLSVYGFVKGMSRPRHSYSWEIIYALRWSVIVKHTDPPRGAWGHWLGPVLALQLFCLMGMTKNARQLFERCIEWVCDHSHAKVQTSWMQKLSAKSKQARLAEVGLEL